MYEEKFEHLLNKCSQDPEALDAFIRDPLPELENAGIPLVQEWSIDSEFSQSLTNLNKYMVNTQPVLAEVAAMNMEELAASVAVAESEHIQAEMHWWGVDIIMNEKLTQDVIQGVTGAGALAGLLGPALGALGVVTAGIAAVIAAGLAAAFALKIGEIKIIDNGNGVHWPITWVQWAALVASVPMGPAGIVTAAMVFIHPVRN